MNIINFIKTKIFRQNIIEEPENIEEIEEEDDYLAAITFTLDVNQQIGIDVTWLNDLNVAPLYAKLLYKLTAGQLSIQIANTLLNLGTQNPEVAPFVTGTLEHWKKLISKSRKEKNVKEPIISPIMALNPIRAKHE